jgi:DNA-binding XRE family transcriptional regulator
MKQLIIVFMSLLVLLTSCKKEPPETSYTWTGQEWIRSLVPVCIVWYKQLPWAETVWEPYKCFSQADANDMRNIILLLTKPEKKEPNPNLKTKNKLSLIFYNGFPEKLTVREVYFEMQDQTFIGPLGKSEKLAKILLRRQEVRRSFYYPYKDLGSDHYLEHFYRLLESQEAAQKQAEKWKVEKEAETQKKTKEANQPE